MNCTVKIKRIFRDDLEFNLNIDEDFMFIHLLKILNNVPEFKIYGYRLNRIFINNKNSNKKVIDSVINNELIIYEVNQFTPKNSLNSIENIIAMHDNKLEKTINLFDVCPINHAKIGEWNGWGRGPIYVPKEEDNHNLRNLIFIVYNNSDPYVYNIHCLFRLINEYTNELLIPHLNKKFCIINEFMEKYTSNSKIKILNINDNKN